MSQRVLFLFFVMCTLLYRCTSPVNMSKEAILAHDATALLGEGALWNHQAQEFYWVDIEGKSLQIFDPIQKQNKVIPLPSRIGTVVPTTDPQRAIIALEDGIYLINTETGELSLFSDIEADKPHNRFNDGKCDPQGRLWVGSMHLPQTEPLGTLYKINSATDAVPMVENVTISNGIVWSSDQTTMYYIDTPTGVIRAFSYDPSTGSISNERIVVEVLPGLGYPDGMAIDAEDKLWVGMWNGGVVARFDPLTGELMSTIQVPAHNVTACAFGGEELDTLYITTASIDMTPEEKKKYPQAGSLFKAVPGVRGVKSTFFKI